MILDSMFDDGKSQAGTAGCFGMALVHPVEPFEDPILMFSRNSDAGIADNQTIILCVDRHAAAGDIVLDGIVAEVVNDLLEHSADTLNGKAITGHINRYILFSSAGCQNFFYILAKL